MKDHYLFPIVIVGVFLIGHLSGYLARVLQEWRRHDDIYRTYEQIENPGAFTAPPLPEDETWIDEIQERVTRAHD